MVLTRNLAKLYQCKNGTKTINLAVKRHINRFPERFMFQLTEEETKNLNIENLRFQFETSSYGNTSGGRRYLPYVFTEQRVTMLATILRTSVAEKVSIQIMDAYSRIVEIMKKSKDKLIIIDSYADKTVLDMISKIEDEVVRNTLISNINEIIK